MNKFCIGCGVALQCEDAFEDGYVNPKMFDDVVMCRRCFRLKNYGEYKVTNKSNAYYQSIIRNVFKMNELVIHIVDVFNMGNMDYIYSKIFCKSILVISKVDIFPKSVNEEKIIKYFKKKYPKYKEVICISSDKNYHLDELYNLIMKYKVSDEVYVVGNSNSGKSTFINKMIKNYTDKKNFIVTSYMPSTTLNVISIKLNDELTLLDTPGILNNGDVNTIVDEDIVKLLNIKDEIKPRIFQVEEDATLIVNKIGRINILNKSNISIYVSNNVEIDRVNSTKNKKYLDLELTKIRVKEDEELVIEGLCFIKVTEKTSFEIYMPNNVDVYKRDKIIG